MPPPKPVDATAALKEEIERLLQQVAESTDAAARARQEAEEHALARESVEQRLAREAEEKDVWEQLAQDTEARLTAHLRGSAYSLPASASFHERASEFTGPGTTARLAMVQMIARVGPEVRSLGTAETWRRSLHQD